jgi:hypothetical protein
MAVAYTCMSGYPSDMSTNSAPIDDLSSVDQKAAYNNDRFRLLATKCDRAV